MIECMGPTALRGIHERWLARLGTSVISNCKLVLKAASQSPWPRFFCCLIGIACLSATSSLLAAQNPAAAAASSGPTVEIESLHLGSIYSYYNPPAGTRFLAVQIKVTNHDSKPLAIRTQDVLLHCDGTDYRQRDTAGAAEQRVPGPRT